MTTGLKGLAGLAGLGIGGGGASDQPEVTTYIANVVAAGGSVSAENKTLLNALIAAGKADGWLSTIQRWFFPSGSDSAVALNVPLIDTLALGNFVSYGLNPSHWTPSGVQGASGAIRYVDSLYVPSTHLVSVNSCCVATHVELENLTSRQFEYPRLFGAKNGNTQWLQLEQNHTSYYSGKMFANAGSAGSGSSQLRSGAIILNRVSSTSLEVINNGSVVASNSTPSSGTRPSVPVFLFAENNGGTPADFSYSRILSWTIGAGMSGSQLSAFASAMAAYKIAKGISVYSLFTDTAVLTNNNSDGVPYEQGFRFTIDVPGKITHLRFFKALSETSGHTGKIWNRDTQELITSVSFSGETSSGWQQQILSSPVNISPGINYAISININSHFVTGTEFYTAHEKNAFNIPVDAGVYALTPNIYPADVYFENYLIDLVFVEDY